MNNETEGSVSIIEQLTKIQVSADSYYKDVLVELEPKVDEIRRLKEDNYGGYRYMEPDFWALISKEMQNVSQGIAARLALLAQSASPLISRSHLLTEVDEREAGHAFKGMRSALRFRDFSFVDLEVVHDEGRVLGVQSATETEQRIKPSEAQKRFQEWCSSLKGRLELADVYTDSSARALVPASSSVATSVRPNTAFIMMWISDDNPELEDVCNRIKECFRRFGIKALRADDIEHEDVITQRIINEIMTAEFLIADITGERPSVYYEIGYAQALGKRVIMYRKSSTRIHFDIAAYNCPEYKNLSGLEKMLMKRLEALTGGPPSFV